MDSRRLQACDPCTAQVPGDLSGDCRFDVSDVVLLQEFVVARGSFQTGATTADPLGTYSSYHGGHSCAWVKTQLNPTLDLFGTDVHGGDTNDARYGQPAITVKDAAQLSRATQYQTRLVAPSVACAFSSDEDGGPQEVRISSSVDGGPNQDVAADASQTAVYFEVRVLGPASPATVSVVRGSRVDSRAPAGGYPAYGYSSSTESGLLVRAQLNSESGRYEAWLRPDTEVGVGTYYASLLVEMSDLGGTASGDATAATADGSLRLSSPRPEISLPTLGPPHDSVEARRIPPAAAGRPTSRASSPRRRVVVG